jgi:hypothetical protein
MACLNEAEPVVWKDYVPLISSSVVITLFIIDRVLSARIRKKEIERNWYLKILIEPTLDKISAFYKSASEQYRDSFERLQNSIGKSKTVTEYLDDVALEIGKFQTLKREFESDVVFPIQMMYSEVGTQLTNLLLDFEDFHNESFSTSTFTEIERKDVIDRLNLNRSLFLKTLYDPLITKTFSQTIIMIWENIKIRNRIASLFRRIKKMVASGKS